MKTFPGRFGSGWERIPGWTDVMYCDFVFDGVGSWSSTQSRYVLPRAGWVSGGKVS